MSKTCWVNYSVIAVILCWIVNLKRNIFSIRKIFFVKFTSSVRDFFVLMLTHIFYWVNFLFNISLRGSLYRESTEIKCFSVWLNNVLFLCICAFVLHITTISDKGETLNAEIAAHKKLLKEFLSNLNKHFSWLV